MLCGCEKKENVEEKTKNPTPTPPTVVEQEYIDDNPIPIGLYDKKQGVRKKISEDSYPWKTGNDIVVLSSFASDKDEISGGNIITVWKDLWYPYDQDEIYKIGYHIAFTTSDGNNVDTTILKPEDSLPFFQYLQIYLYDDIHQNGGWYSHVEHMDENTILSSIKLTPGEKIDQINSNIEVTTFSYNGEEDFKDGKYRGKSKFTSIIKRAN